MFVSFTNYSFTLPLPLYCPLTYPGAHTLLSLSSTPTVHEVDKLTVGHVASQRDEVAPHLMVESYEVCKINGSGHPEEASRGALSRWLKDKSDTDIAEKTRCSVLEAQEARRNIPLVEQLKLFEKSSEEPVTGLASPPGTFVCVNRMFVSMDTVCNVHTLHCSENLPNVVSPLTCLYSESSVIRTPLVKCHKHFVRISEKFG